MTKRGRGVWFSPVDRPGRYDGSVTQRKNRNADTFTDRVMNAAVGGAFNCIQSRSAASRGETKAFSHRRFPPHPPHRLVQHDSFSYPWMYYRKWVLNCQFVNTASFFLLPLTVLQKKKKKSMFPHTVKFC